MKVAYTTHDVSQAELIRGLLEGAGIRAMIVGAELSAVVGEVPFSAALPRVMVNEADLVEAQTLIDRSGFKNESVCPTCGYSLEGLPTTRCPECGMEFKRRATEAAWLCPACGEECEGQFTSCWKCSTDRP